MARSGEFLGTQHAGGTTPPMSQRLHTRILPDSSFTRMDRLQGYRIRSAIIEGMADFETKYQAVLQRAGGELQSTTSL